MAEPDSRATLRDPLADSAWSRPDTVAGFVRSPPNETLLRIAGQASMDGRDRLLDIGCGAGRNAIPLTNAGWQVVGTDLSVPMLGAARTRASEEGVASVARFLLAPMDALPFRDDTFDFIVAHGIWNLARSDDEFRRAVADAARVARQGCALFLFTFSRHTLPKTASPVADEMFVFTQFSGQPQCFLTHEQVVSELGAAGFEPDARLPLHELNRPRPGDLMAGKGPVIHEGLFVRAS